MAIAGVVISYYNHAEGKFFASPHLLLFACRQLEDLAIAALAE
jgi:hypothetical protein